mmetsp:Transcript_14245/g.46101  ORF Transcript_14245/g.46101 Transcript_14245/m.46101 type:complete len:111 (-) Transcript_14245:231-563(-)
MNKLTGTWECPRHRCVGCGARQIRGGCKAGQARGGGRGPKPPPAEGVELWRCRTCPHSYCSGCLPEKALHSGDEIICTACQELLHGDLSMLQRDLLTCDPDQFAASVGVG